MKLSEYSDFERLDVLNISEPLSIIQSSKMVRVYAVIGDVVLRNSVDQRVLDAKIIEAVAVRRPLDIPGTRGKVGVVLSHSGVVATTKYGPIIVEFMGTNQILINKVHNFSLEKREFMHKRFKYIWHTMEPQTPNRDVTIREFAAKMAEFTRLRKFDTFSHNCHHARFYAMSQFGMKSENPDAAPRNMFFQGFVDYFTLDTD